MQYAIKERSEGVAASGPSLRLTLTNKLGDLKAIYWSVPPEVAAACKVGEVIEPQGEQSEWKGEPQLKITSLRVLTKAEVRYEDLLPVSPFDRNQQKERLSVFLESVENQYLRRFLYNHFGSTEFMEQYTRWPAAVHNHHAWIGGLLDHCLEVTEIAVSIGKNWPGMCNRDILVVGALGHDVGKLQEINIGAAFEFTTVGRLEGHVSLGMTWLDRNRGDLPFDLYVKIRHIIASHHGEQSWGAIQVPKTADAIAVHLADLSSARMTMASQAITGHTSDDPWTPYDRTAKAQFYVGDK